jgi:transcriptional regulator with XRE-family HTH domain
MVIGERLKDLREQKRMSQGDVEKRTGLLQKLGFVKYNGGLHVDGSLSSTVLREEDPSVRCSSS